MPCLTKLKAYPSETLTSSRPKSIFCSNYRTLFAMSNDERSRYSDRPSGPAKPEEELKRPVRTLLALVGPLLLVLLCVPALQGTAAAAAPPAGQATRHTMTAFTYARESNPYRRRSPAVSPRPRTPPGGCVRSTTPTGTPPSAPTASATSTRCAPPAPPPSSRAPLPPSCPASPTPTATPSATAAPALSATCATTSTRCV